MTDFFAVHVRPDGTHEVYITPDGISRIPVPRAAFGNPRDAIRYAEMRQLAVSPLRRDEEARSPESLPGPRLGRAEDTRSNEAAVS